jgi:hypothetical protein
MFGRTGSRPVPARAPHATRYRRTSEKAYATGIGDLDGDGRGELVITVNLARRPWHDAREALAVVFGHRRRAVVAPAKAGYLIDLPKHALPLGLRAAGDVNGDGLGDFAVEIQGWKPDGPATAVIFGKSDRTRQRVAALGSGGYIIR